MKLFRHMYHIFSIVVPSVLFFSNCASVIHGTQQDISITSEPPAASALVFDEEGYKVAKAKIFLHPTPFSGVIFGILVFNRPALLSQVCLRKSAGENRVSQ